MDATRSRGRIALILALGLLPPAAHAAPARAAGWQQPEFVIGGWIDPLHGGFNMDSTAVRHSLQQAKDAHFNLLTGAPSSCPTNHWTNVTVPDLDYLTYANELGFHVMFTHPVFTGCLRADCGADLPPPLNSFMSNAVLTQYDEAGADAISPAQNDAAMGYLLWDEPNFTVQRQTYMKDWIQAMHANDTTRNDGHSRATYVNFQPGLDCSDYPDWDTAMQAFVNDPDPVRRLDVASITLYSLHGPTDQPTYAQYFGPLAKLHAWMNPRPFWALGVMNGVLSATSLPDDDQMRFFAYASAAAGAKGLIWFTYGTGCPAPCTNPAAYDTAAALFADVIPTRRYGWVRTINRYMRDVVGPVVMHNEHRGLFHESTAPTPEPVPLIANNLAACPASSLGDPNLAVGVFQPAGSSDESFLLVFNKSMNATTATVTLQSPHFIALAPRALDHEGGADYTALGSGTRVSFPLAGGEGRMLHLTATPTQDLALLEPQGGGTWRPGETRTVRWNSAGAPVALELVTRAAGEGAALAGPRVVLGSDLAGTEASVTMPDVAARDAYLVLSATGTDGITRRVATEQPFSTVDPPAMPPAYGAFGSGAWFATGAVTTGPDGRAHVAYALPDGVVRYARNDGAGWSVEGVPKQTPGIQADVSPALAADANGTVHLVFSGTDGGTSLRTGASLVYARRDPAGVWGARIRLAATGDAPGRPAIAVANSGDVFVAFNSGVVGGRRLRVLRLPAGAATWQSWGDAPAGDPGSICLRTDSAGLPWVGFTVAGAARIVRMGQTSSASVLDMPGPFGALSFALDPSDRPTVAWSRVDEAGGAEPGRAILYANRLGAGGWSAPCVVDPTAGTVEDLAVAMNAGRARVAYVRNGLAMCARETASGWAREVVDDLARAEAPVSLAFAPDGERWAGYFDRRVGAFRTAMAPDDTSGGAPGPDQCPTPVAPVLLLRTANPALRGQPLQLTIEANRPATVTLALYDIAGRRVAARPPVSVVAGTNVLDMPMDGVPPGLFLIRATWDQGAGVTRRVAVR